MRSGWRLLSVVVVCGVMVCPVAMAAKPKVPVPSTWTLDVMRSDFGDRPGMKSDVFTVHSDTAALLSLDFVTVDDQGRTMKSAWNGPQNGKLLPVDGMAGTSFGIDAQGDEHWVFADGSSSVGKLSVSKDKQSLMVRLTVQGKDGKVYRQVLMYSRSDM